MDTTVINQSPITYCDNCHKEVSISDTNYCPDRDMIVCPNCDLVMEESSNSHD